MNPIDRKKLSLWLSLWAAISMIVALIGFIIQPSFARGSVRWIIQSIAAECLFWGLLEVGVALAGLRAANAMARGKQSPQSIEKSSRQLARLLAFVVRLNWAFIALGIALIFFGVVRHVSPAIGHGIGILLQSAFLLLLDRHFLQEANGERAGFPIEPTSSGR